MICTNKSQEISEEARLLLMKSMTCTLICMSLSLEVVVTLAGFLQRWDFAIPLLVRKKAFFTIPFSRLERTRSVCVVNISRICMMLHL